MSDPELDRLRKEYGALLAKLHNTETDLELSEMSVTTLRALIECMG